MKTKTHRFKTFKEQIAFEHTLQDNFADVLDPDAITVIDYLDMNSEFYLAGVEIDNIFRKLKNDN